MTKRRSLDFNLGLLQHLTGDTFEADCLPAPFDKLCTQVAERKHVDESMSAAVMLGIVSCACTGTFSVDTGGGAWIEPVQLYWLVSAPPGAKKSVLASVYAEKLKQLEGEYITAIEPKLIAQQHALDVISRRIEYIKKQQYATDGTDIDFETLNHEIQKLNDQRTQLINEGIRPYRLFYQNATAEGLESLLAEYQGRGALCDTEGGLFNVIAGQYSSGVVNDDCLKKGYSGEQMIIDRMSRHTVINHTYLSALMLVQPIVAAKSMQNETLYTDGFWARWFTIQPESLSEAEEFDDLPISGDLLSAWHSLMTDLFDIQTGLALPESTQHALKKHNGTYCLHLSEAAHEAFKTWFAWHAHALADDWRELPRDCFDKSAGSLLRLAALMKLLRDHRSTNTDTGAAVLVDNTIEKDDIDRAQQVLNWIFSHIIAVHGNAHPAIGTMAERVLKAIYHIMDTDETERPRKKTSIPLGIQLSDITRAVGGNVTNKELHDALDKLVVMGDIELHTDGRARIYRLSAKRLIVGGYAHSDAQIYKPLPPADKDIERGALLIKYDDYNNRLFFYQNGGWFYADGVKLDPATDPIISGEEIADISIQRDEFDEISNFVILSEADADGHAYSHIFTKA